MTTSSLAEVENFWNSNLCGNQFVNDEKFTKEFYENYRNYRYNKEHHIIEIISAPENANQDVLEIGLGIGADGTEWAKRSKSYTGVDLTDEAVFATSKHLQLRGLMGNVVKGNAEALPFENESFDIVYSHGVLHHSPNIENTFNQVNRVLRPGGKFIIMLYSKNSFNYWVRIQFYFRLRMLFEILKSKIGISSNPFWTLHLNNFKKKGWEYLSWNEFPHHCTDGPDCTIANIYWTSDAIDLLAKNGLIVTKTEKTHLPIFKGKFKNFERFLASHFGFFQFYWGHKA